MENETEPLLDPRPLILKRMVWDVFPHESDAIRAIHSNLGLVPDDEDGEDAEHSASDTRINRVAPLHESLAVLSGYAGEVMGQYLLAVATAGCEEEVELPEDFQEQLAAQNSETIYNGAYAILAHLMDTGVLEYGSRFSE